MRIAHYLNHIEKANGHVAVCIDLACEQARNGHDVFVVSGPGDFEACLAANGVTHCVTPIFSGPLRIPRMALSFLRIARKIRPDLVNAHMVAAAVAARIVRPFCGGFGLVTTVHNSFDRQAFLMGVGDRVIAVSDAVRDQMIGKGVAPARLRTVTNGTIGGARRPPEPDERDALRHPAITTVAGLHARKGIHHLIEAFNLVHARHPDAHLYIVGDGPMRTDYESQAAASPAAAAIHFLGHRDDPRTTLGASDIFVLASLNDPCPLVISEARQMGCAIIGTDVDGIPDALHHGRKGVLVPPADPSALAGAMATLIEDEARRAGLAAAAQADLDEITVSRVSERTLAVYRELCADAHDQDRGGSGNSGIMDRLHRVTESHVTAAAY